MKTTDEVLQERGSVYGNFTDGSNLESELMALIAYNHQKQRGKALTELERIFFSKIIMKLSRLSVTPDHVDSWTDIAGYARLVEQHYERLQNDSRRVSTQQSGSGGIGEQASYAQSSTPRRGNIPSVLITPTAEQSYYKISTARADGLEQR